MKDLITKASLEIEKSFMLGREYGPGRDFSGFYGGPATPIGITSMGERYDYTSGYWKP